MTPAKALPLYVQLSEMLIRDIAAGRLADGDRLPPERDLAARLGTSVGTLRKALADLTEKGLLERRQGSGNYIRSPGQMDSVYAFFRVERHDGGGLPTAQVLSVEHRPKPADLPVFGTAPTAHCIRRLRFLDRVPAVVEEIWLDASYAETLRANDLSDSLYLTYRETLGLWISRAEDRLSLAPLPDWTPADFGRPPGALSLLSTRISFDQTGAPAEVSRNWINPDVATYVARIT